MTAARRFSNVPGMGPRRWCHWETLATRAIDACDLGEETDHGPDHWRRVERNGLWICSRTAADPMVVGIFAWLHDCRRQAEFDDPDHGRRAAQFAGKLRGGPFGLPDASFALLLDALRGHADGLVSDEPTIGACWDADRLDLGRVGISPDPGMMCTAPGREAAAGEIEIPDEPPGLPGRRGTRMGVPIADAPDRGRGG